MNKIQLKRKSIIFVEKTETPVFSDCFHVSEKETEKAILIYGEVNSLKKHKDYVEFWLPKSQIKIEEFESNLEYDKIIIPSWLYNRLNFKYVSSTTRVSVY